MENYTITKEQILELSEINKTVKYYLQKEFPEAFKKELELGKWYKSKESIFNHQLNGESYGIHCEKWINRNWYTDQGGFETQPIEASPQEVETALSGFLQKELL